MEYQRETLTSRRKVDYSFHHLIANRKIIVLIYILLSLWVALAAQYIVKKVFREETGITQAFMNSNMGLAESTLEVTATYGSKVLSEEEKKGLIEYIAKGLGIRTENGLDITTSDSRAEMSFNKEAKRANTTIKVISLLDNSVTDAFAQVEENSEATHYILIRLTIFEDLSSDILEYQKRLENLLEDLKIEDKNRNTTLQFTGNYSGNLTLEDRNGIANDMIHKLQGKIVYENRDNELYTIYAYTGAIPAYIKVDKNKINLQVAMSYNEQTDTTKVYLATPMISGDW